MRPLWHEPYHFYSDQLDSARGCSEQLARSLLVPYPALTSPAPDQLWAVRQPFHNSAVHKFDVQLAVVEAAQGCHLKAVNMRRRQQMFALLLIVIGRKVRLCRLDSNTHDIALSSAFQQPLVADTMQQRCPIRTSQCP